MQVGADPGDFGLPGSGSRGDSVNAGHGLRSRFRAVAPIR
jgi:hypothetical protein